MSADEDKVEELKRLEIDYHAPLLWYSSAVCKIQDLHEDKYEEVLRLIKHHYFREEPMCKATSLLRDEESVKGYVELVTTWLKDTTSLVALSSTSGRITGVAVLRINSFPDLDDVYNRITVPAGDALGKIMDLQNALIVAAKAYDFFKTVAYLRIFLLCVHPSYADTEVPRVLLDASADAAGSLKMPAVGGIFGSASSQELAKNAGFDLVAEISYSRWRVDDRVIFDEVGRGNYSAAFMGKLVPKEKLLDDAVLLQD